MGAVRIGQVSFDQQQPLSLIAGPCSLETLDHALMMAESLSKICAARDIGFVFKASFDKANRTAGDMARGVGLDAALEIFRKLKEHVGCPVLTDVHEAEQCAPVAEIVDALQIPAFLCRQTSLLQAAGRTGRCVNIKKGQFLAAEDMKFAAEKVMMVGNENILLTERGVSFGYRNLVVDMRNLVIMAETGYPVIFDATHSVQSPGGEGGKSGGKREFVPPLARAALAVGVAGLFIETHQDPDSAPSDGPNMVQLSDMATLLDQLQMIDRCVKPTLTRSA
ncbi:MAG: 3-deoxy-8-phosphooctulonate synthase [Alphaproteobacteria bacterium]|nr:3-deoxy-8-phosphooctulonate synthase [Alphaproteobacteria bacterium]